LSIDGLSKLRAAQQLVKLGGVYDQIYDVVGNMAVALPSAPTEDFVLTQAPTEDARIFCFVREMIAILLLKQKVALDAFSSGVTIRGLWLLLAEFVELREEASGLSQGHWGQPVDLDSLFAEAVRAAYKTRDGRANITPSEEDELDIGGLISLRVASLRRRLDAGRVQTDAVQMEALLEEGARAFLSSCRLRATRHLPLVSSGLLDAAFSVPEDEGGAVSSLVHVVDCLMTFMTKDGADDTEVRQTACLPTIEMALGGLRNMVVLPAFAERLTSSMGLFEVFERHHLLELENHPSVQELAWRCLGNVAAAPSCRPLLLQQLVSTVDACFACASSQAALPVAREQATKVILNLALPENNEADRVALVAEHGRARKLLDLVQVTSQSEGGPVQCGIWSTLALAYSSQVAGDALCDATSREGASDCYAAPVIVDSLRNSREEAITSYLAQAMNMLVGLASEKSVFRFLREFVSMADAASCYFLAMLSRQEARHQIFFETGAAELIIHASTLALTGDEAFHEYSDSLTQGVLNLITSTAIAPSDSMTSKLLRWQRALEQAQPDVAADVKPSVESFLDRAPTKAVTRE
jgi:hypothetical protein